ncbi:subclass B3 metallo-beta-lactamase [Novosphingobium sp. TH158]|uniref:subclass B3 metallo-beta-lactamase n=1 Tax=Novosphingobium sp. TH158 TaxID=2067455 RepID=UPI0020B13E3F|nr:subclass B3 metallo-beta-lactamase [Novosphingobium sp. TH158]
MSARPAAAGVLAAAILATGLAAPSAAQPLPPRPGETRNIAAACAGKDGWAQPAPPARLFGRTYYVGTCGITALLVETRAGLVLLDAGVPEAAPLVLENIRRLGFSPRMVRWIVISHEHYDHAGAVAAIQRETGARVIAGPFQSDILSSGKPSPEDPQAPLLEKEPMQPLQVAYAVRNNGTLNAGSVVFTAHATPAHSPGSTSWTWRECEGAVCRTIAYADSATTISADGYRFADNPKRVGEVRSGIAKIAALPCDIIVTPHPSSSGLFPRMSGIKPLALPGSCRTYADAALKRFEERLASETRPVSAAK